MFGSPSDATRMKSAPQHGPYAPMSTKRHIASRENLRCVFHVPNVRVALDIGGPASQVRLPA